MSDSSIGFVVVENKDFIEIIARLCRAIEGEGYKVDDVRYSWLYQYAMVYFSRHVQKPIGVKRTKRQIIHVHFTCDTDHDDIQKGPKVFWTSSTYLDGPAMVLKIAEKMDIFGPVWYTPNDGEGNWRRIAQRGGKINNNA